MLATEASVNTVHWRIPLTGTQELSKGALYLFDRSNRPSSKRAGSRLVWVFLATRPGKPPEGFRDFLPAPKWGGGNPRLRARDDSWPRAAFGAKSPGNVKPRRVWRQLLAFAAPYHSGAGCHVVPLSELRHKFPRPLFQSVARFQIAPGPADVTPGRNVRLVAAIGAKSSFHPFLRVISAKSLYAPWPGPDDCSPALAASIRKTRQAPIDASYAEEKSSTLRKEARARLPGSGSGGVG